MWCKHSIYKGLARHANTLGGHVCRLKHDISKRLAEMTDHSLRENHCINASARLKSKTANALDDRVAQEIRTKVADHAIKMEDRLV